MPPEIVVTAPALPDPAGEAAFAVVKLGPDELADAPSTQLDQILKSVAGLQLFRRSDARSANPTSQGVTLRALGGNASSRALLVLDGVPQTDPFGGWINWPAFEPAALASVRVVRGGGSVVNGPGALAGTIDMRSRIDAGAALAVEGGSRGGLEASLRAGLAGGLSVAARLGRSDGFVPVTRDTRGPADRRAPYDQAGLRAQLSRPLAGAVDMQLALSGFRDKRERGLAFTANRTNGVDASLRLVGTGSTPWSLLGFGQWRDFRSSFASVDGGRTSASRVSFQDSVPASGIGAAAEIRPQLGQVELRVGADLRHVDGESRELYSYVLGAPTRRRIAGGAALTTGVYTELAVKRGPLSLSAGARLDRWRIADGALREWLISSGSVLRDDRFGARTGCRPTARTGALYRLSEPLALRAAAYLGWRLPTLNELFRPFRAGADATAANPLLDPERLAGAEVGIRWRRGAIALDGTAFANRLRDGIANVTLGRGPGLFPGVGFVAGEYRQRRNLDAVRVRGLELDGRYEHGFWSARLGYSYARARVAADGPAAPLAGLQPAQTPRHVLTAALAWVDAGRELSLHLRRVGRQWEDDLNQRPLPAATTFDLFGAVPLGNSLRLVARAENLFDARVVAGVGSDGVIERATPRTLWLGVRLNARPD